MTRAFWRVVQLLDWLNHVILRAHYVEALCDLWDRHLDVRR